MAELDRIRSGDVTEEEISAARSYLMGVFPATVETANDLGNRIQELELYDLPDDYFEEYRDRIAVVNADDVTRVAREYIHPDEAAIVIVGAEREVRSSLEDLGYPLSLYDVHE